MISAYLVKLLFLFQNIFYILLGLLGIGFCIGFHELGHFLFAKLFGVRIPSFSIGFGPKVISKKIGETAFSLSAIPLGGYVEIAGAAEIGQGEQKDAHATDEGSFASKPYYQKMCIMLGGILFNILFAYAAIIILFMTGIPKTLLIQKPFISAIHQNSPAEKYELKIGDRIIALDNETVEDNLQKIRELSQAIPLKETTITIERDGKIVTKTIIMGSKEEETANIGFLGVEFDNAPIPPHSPLDAIREGISATNTWIRNTVIGFTQLRKNHKNIGGPIMIIAATTKAAANGFKIFILLLAIISINLAVLNLIIPLPVLDGGQMLFYSIEAIIRRPIPDKIREYIHIATWLFFIVLIIYLSAQDISRIVSPYITPLLQYFGYKG